MLPPSRIEHTIVVIAQLRLRPAAFRAKFLFEAFKEVVNQDGLHHQ